MTKDTPTVIGSTARLIDWLIAAAVTAVCFLFFTKIGNLHVPGPEQLDDAWQAAVQFAWLHNLQFGRDIIFPHGPYGAFYASTFHPDLIGLWYLIRLPHALVLAITLVWTLRVLARGPAAARLPATLLALVAAGATVSGIDPLWILPSFLMIALALDDGPTPPGLLALLVLAIAFATLAKFSFLVMGVTALVAWTIAAAYRRDPMALLAPPLYAAVVAGLWWLAGQEMDGFVEWVRVSFLVASGYAAAMSLSSSREDLAVYGVLVLVLLFGVWGGFRRETPWPVKAAVLLGWIAMFAFVAKAGFVRHDGHALFPFGMALIAGVLLVARLLPRIAERPRRLAAQTLCLVLAAGWLVEANTRLFNGQRDLMAKLAEPIRLAPAHYLEALNDVLSEQRRVADYAATAQEARRLLGGPHPRIVQAQSVDVFSANAGAAIIAGLPYHPRPVIQSYQAYLPELAARDVAQVRENGAAAYVLHPFSVDTRPILADGGHLWPAFLSHYDPVAMVPLGLVIERRQTPLNLETRTAFDGKVAFNDWVDLPSRQPGTIVQIQGDLPPTVIGRAMSLAFKPPQITLTLRRADGREETHQLVPGQLGAGFPISPILTNAGEIRALFESEAAGAPVTAIRVNAGWVQQGFWSGPFSLTVTEIRRPGQG
ncbi:MAG: hypothetical protein ACMVO3_23870 [Thalassobaculum sp.]